MVEPGGQHIARKADITLATDDFQLDFDEPGYGFDLGPADGIGSQDFEIDLGLNFGDGPAAEPELPQAPEEEEESMEVEVGRDAAPARGIRESLDSHLLGPHGDDMELDILSHRSREPSEHPFGGDAGLDFGPDIGMDIDLGIDFGDKPPSEREQTPHLTPSRACEYYFILVSSTCLSMLVSFSIPSDGTATNTASRG